MGEYRTEKMRDFAERILCDLKFVGAKSVAFKQVDTLYEFKIDTMHGNLYFRISRYVFSYQDFRDVVMANLAVLLLVKTEKA